VLRNDFDTNTPIEITQPGSYKLGENIQGFPDQDGITISVSGVTLDLNGFEIRGNNEVGSTNGILIDGELDNITILNGNVIGFFEVGIRGELADNVRIEGVRANYNGLGGMIARTNIIYTRCSAEGNGGLGIGAGVNATFTDCASYQNGGAGFVTGTNGAATNCAAWENGSHGFVTGEGAALSNCAARKNGEHGFSVNQFSSVINCTAVDNGMVGFIATNACTFLNCTAALNDSHGYSTTQSLIRGCMSITNGGAKFNDIVGTQYYENF